MDRIGPAGGAPTVALSNGQQGFVDENLSVGQTGTSVVAEWLNVLQEELMTLLVSAQIAPDITNFGQIMQSIVALIGSSSGGYASSTGYGYFKVPGPVPLKVAFGPFSLANAGITQISQLLPIAFDHAFVSGVATDGYSAAYTYGLGVGADLSHVTIWCPAVQVINGSLQTRSYASGRFIAVGM